jgi:hypothetical protein
MLIWRVYQDYSDSESDDSPVSEIDWEMIAAAAAAEDRTQDGN